jgi:hypothetical protein
MPSTQSTVTLQNIYDILLTYGELAPGLTKGGYGLQPMLTIADDVMQAFCDVSFPWKWNSFNLPVFYANSYQQDYALSLTNLAWLEDGTAIDINNDSVPKPCSWIEVGRRQSRRTSALIANNIFRSPVFTANSIPNNQMYYGTWGLAGTGNATWGNNPVSGSVYANPLGANESQPSNPITQIQDANGNYLILTGYGTEGTTAPVAPANSAAGTVATPGTGATTVWTVVDPYGSGIRLTPVPSASGCVWQINLVGQMKPVRFSSFAQTLFPLTDDYESHFRQGCVAQAYRYSPEAKVRAKFAQEWALWKESLVEARSESDRERDEDRFIVERTILQAGGGGAGGYLGPYNPYLVGF